MSFHVPDSRFSAVYLQFRAVVVIFVKSTDVCETNAININYALSRDAAIRSVPFFDKIFIDGSFIDRFVPIFFQAFSSYVFFFLSRIRLQFDSLLMFLETCSSSLCNICELI